MKSNRYFFIFFFLSFFVITCCTNLNYNSAPKETVLPNGNSIIVQTKYGELRIEAISDTERSYKWEGKSVTARLIPRESRWYGKLGLYHPNLKPPHKNVVHMTVEEHQSRYQSLKQFERYRNVYPNAEEIYNDTGLFVRFRKEVSPEGAISVNILVCQILIDGEKPKHLPGSQNHKIYINDNT